MSLREDVRDQRDTLREIQQEILRQTQETREQTQLLRTTTGNQTQTGSNRTFLKLIGASAVSPALGQVSAIRALTKALRGSPPDPNTDLRNRGVGGRLLERPDGGRS